MSTYQKRNPGWRAGASGQGAGVDRLHSHSTATIPEIQGRIDDEELARLELLAGDFRERTIEDVPPDFAGVEPDRPPIVKAGRQNLRLVDTGSIMTAAVPAPPFAIDGLVPRGVPTLLGGHGGAGKSIVGLTLCAHVAGGAHTWAKHRVDDGRAVFVSLEDGANVLRYRLRNIIEAYELDADKVLRRLAIVDGTEGDAALAYEATENGSRRLVLSTVYDEVARLAEGARLVVIDNASDAFDSSENDRRMVRGFVRALGKIARDNNAGLILLAHIDKAAARNGSQGNSYSGSTAWHNSARSRLAMIGSNDSVELIHEKANFGKLAEPIRLGWAERGVLLPVDAHAADGGIGDAEHVLAAMRAAQAASVDVGSARTGPATAQTVLATFAELPAHLRGTKGRSAFWMAMGRLQASGRVEVREVVTSQRKLRKVLACASSA